MSATIQCRSCMQEHPATDVLKRCTCGGKSYRILYRNDPPSPSAHSYIDSGGLVQFTKDEDAA